MPLIDMIIIYNDNDSNSRIRFKKKMIKINGKKFISNEKFSKR